MDRQTELLITAYKLLKKQSETPYVLDILSETVNYDGVLCDGNCLMEDIEAYLLEYGIEVNDI